MYKFSNFVPTSSDQALHSHANEVSKLWHERFGHMNYRYLQTLHKEGMVEGLPQIQPSTGACIGCVIGKHPEERYKKGKGSTTTFRSKIQRKNHTVRGFLFLNLPKITRIHFFFVNVATSVA